MVHVSHEQLLQKSSRLMRVSGRTESRTVRWRSGQRTSCQWQPPEQCPRHVAGASAAPGWSGLGERAYQKGTTPGASRALPCAGSLPCSLGQMKAQHWVGGHARRRPESSAHADQAELGGHGGALVQMNLTNSIR